MPSTIAIRSAILIATLAMATVSPELRPKRDAKTRAPHRHGLAVIRHTHDDGTSESTNWSGYAVTGSNGAFTQVTGSWIVPAVSCPAATSPTHGRGSSSSNDSYASFWVGIDGWTSPSVEQIGTDSDCDNGAPSYYAWYEFYPEPSYYAGSLTNLNINDVIVASVTYNSNGTFTAAITDETSGGSYTATFTPSAGNGHHSNPAPLRSSAEWITEAPSSGNSILPLSNFGFINWGPDYTNGVGANTATITGANPAAIGTFGSNINEAIMVSKSNVVISQPSAFSSTSSFTVTRESPGTP